MLNCEPKNKKKERDSFLIDTAESSQSHMFSRYALTGSFDAHFSYVFK